jgi:hypothetical protein
VEEARAVLARLDRIEALERVGTPPAVLLGEVRALLNEAEAWVRAEPRRPGAACDAIERCAEALERRPSLSFAGSAE